MASNSRYKPLVAVSGYLRGKVPVVDDDLSSHEQEIYSTTSPHENCIEFEFQTQRNYYVGLRKTYLAVKFKNLGGLVYETYNTKENKKKHKEEANTDEETLAEEEQEDPLPLVSLVNNVFFSIFYNAGMYINNQQTQLYSIVCAQVLHFQRLQGVLSLNVKESCTAKGTTMKFFLMKFWKHFCRNLFSQGE